MIKNKIQKIIRHINIFLNKKKFPNQIVVYFHDTQQIEIDAIQDIILFFKNIDYEFVTISEISKNLGTEKKLFTFTFDDGFKSWKNLIPIFDKYKVEATFFLNSVFLTDEGNDMFINNIGLDDKDKIINVDIINDLIKNDHEIGAHTHSHFKLSNLNFEDFKDEIQKNLDILRQFSENINSFAIPFGMRRYLKNEQIGYLENNFKTICYGEAGMLFDQDHKNIQRYPWQIELTFYQNLINLSTDTNLFNKLTKRSGLG
tara:strand:+ start:232 stop:1005 length:774 start_codon:yes stop_codon:yes gene_type:complete